MVRFRSLLATLLLVLAALDAHALEIRQTLWGFDGRVVPERFNPVSVLVANPSANAFDGELLFSASIGLGVRDADVAQAVYLAPRTERWVQFQIFIRDSTEFRLRWGRGAKDEVELPAPTRAGPARVLLTDPSNPFAVAGGLRAFSDDLFPTSVAGTDALDAVVLDHVPRWEPSRRDAFLDWLRHGGTVMVLQGANGSYPEFSDALGVLNITGEVASVGSGTVLRQASTRREASDKLFADRGFPALEIKSGKDAVIYDLERTLFDRLASLTKPKISWWIINLLTACYVLLVGPLHYRWAKKRDYRVSIGIFAGTVLLFGWLFAMVGRRGYGESQTVHSVSIAHSLGGGRCDVMQWVSAFATRGDLYSLSHVSPASYYSGVPMSDAVQGRIYNGKDGKFLADIPLYSSRAFVHSGVMQGDDTTVTLDKWEHADDKLKQLDLTVGSNFPRDVMEAHVLYRNHFYKLQRNGNRLGSPAYGLTLGDFLSHDKLRQLTYNYNASPDETADAKSLDNLFPLMAARALGGTAAFAQSVPTRSLPPDQAQLWIYARSPDGFRMRGEGFGHENGRVLYIQDITMPPTGPAAN